MKTTAVKTWTVVGASVLTLAALPSRADQNQSPTTAKPDKTYTGTVTAVDPQNHTLQVRGFLWSEKFNLGDNCAYVLLDQPQGAISDLRPGEKVKVSYQDYQGVRAADRVQQEPIRCEGTVKAIDPAAHTMTVHSGMMDKKFQLADDCAVTLRQDKSGALADVQPGDFVTVTYETPEHKLVARQIAQTGQTFTGKLTAIDLGQKTLKAKTVFDTKKFNVGDHCAIVINGQVNGKLSDLRPDENLTFTYNEVNGVNIVNRIAPANAAQTTETTASRTPMGY
jgi:Cu/Ag efflux protein CusF